MSDKQLQSTLRELHTLLSRPRLWLVFALMVGLFVVTGPFGTHERLAFPTRLGYWLVLHATTWTCALTSIAFFDTVLSTRVPSRLTRMLTGAVASALPVGLAITVINFALLMRPLNAERVFENTLVALPIGLAFSLLCWLSLSAANQFTGDSVPDAGNAAAISSASPASPAATGPDNTLAAADRPALLDRVPVDKRGSLIRLEMQDHYVLAVTTRGTELLLMRLTDAIVEAGAGQQIHRSHWVSDAGIEAITRQGGKSPKLMVQTNDGIWLPVSRSYAAQIRARWGDRIST